MNEIFDQLKTGTVVTGGAIAAALITISAYLPKLLNGIKSDKIEGSVLNRLMEHEKRMARMDRTIHRQQIRLTKFVALYIKLQAHIYDKNIPQEILDELAGLVKDSTAPEDDDE
jgi:hypothetical protein